MTQKNLTDKLQETYKALLGDNKIYLVGTLVESNHISPSADILEQRCLYYLGDVKPSECGSRWRWLEELLKTFKDYIPEDVVSEVRNNPKYKKYQEQRKHKAEKELKRMFPPTENI